MQEKKPQPLIIYKVFKIAHYGFEEELGFFKTKTAALKELRANIAIAKKDNQYADNDEIDGKVKNGVLKKLSEEDRNREFLKEHMLYRAIVHKWYKTSYEYDEYDLTQEIYAINQIEIK